MSILSWPFSERPRGRLLAKGTQTLSDAELLAVLLRNGVKGKDAVSLARELLAGLRRTSIVLAKPILDATGVKWIIDKAAVRLVP